MQTPEKNCRRCGIAHEPCGDCGRVYHQGEWPWCPHGFPATGRVYSGRKLWAGAEVYGNRLGSDELRADTEGDLLRDSEWARERVARSKTPPDVALR